AFVNFLWELLRKPADVIFIQHFAYTGRSALNNFIQQLLDLTFLPYEVYANTTAIVRTLWRMYISRRNLLQWKPYNSSQQWKNSIARSYITMWFEPVFAVLVYIYLT